MSDLERFETIYDPLPEQDAQLQRECISTINLLKQEYIKSCEPFMKILADIQNRRIPRYIIRRSAHTESER